VTPPDACLGLPTEGGGCQGWGFAMDDRGGGGPPPRSITGGRCDRRFGGFPATIHLNVARRGAETKRGHPNAHAAAPGGTSHAPPSGYASTRVYP
jgi:hypothetical protein